MAFVTKWRNHPRPSRRWHIHTANHKNGITYKWLLPFFPISSFCFVVMPLWYAINDRMCYYCYYNSHVYVHTTHTPSPLPTFWRKEMKINLLICKGGRRTAVRRRRRKTFYTYVSGVKMKNKKGAGSHCSSTTKLVFYYF